jgi:hypothetical protein
MGHGGEFKPYFSLFIKYFGDHMCGNDISNDIGMADLNAFRRNLHIPLSPFHIMFSGDMPKKKPAPKGNGLIFMSRRPLAHL